jgi:hypothetical protein
MVKSIQLRPLLLSKVGGESGLFTTSILFWKRAPSTSSPFKSVFDEFDHRSHWVLRSAQIISLLRSEDDKFSKIHFSLDKGERSEGGLIDRRDENVITAGRSDVTSDAVRI